MAATPSPNFSFLLQVDQILVDLGARAEKYAFTDPNAALVKTRQLAEMLLKQITMRSGGSDLTSQFDRIKELQRAGIIPPEIARLLHEVRKKGNDAVHEVYGEKREALYQLKTVRKVAVWFFKTFYDRHFKAGAFVPPPNPADADEALKSELERLRDAYVENMGKLQSLAEKVVDESEHRIAAEAKAEQAYEELETALQLGLEDNERLTSRIAEYEELLEQQLSLIHI